MKRKTLTSMVLAGFCLLSGCATQYKICLDANALCSEVKTYRQIGLFERCVTYPDGREECMRLEGATDPMNTAVRTLGNLVSTELPQ